MVVVFSWLTFDLNIYFSHNLKPTCMPPQVPVSQNQELKLCQRRFDANKKVMHHRQQKK